MSVCRRLHVGEEPTCKDGVDMTCETERGYLCGEGQEKGGETPCEAFSVVN